MAEYEFTLRFRLRSSDESPDAYLDDLFESGCDDAIVGVGGKGSISLNFTRNSDSAAEAVKSAIRDVYKAIPSATLLELAPDLMNTTEIADEITEKVHKITRQVIRKYATGQSVKVKTRFPDAAISGSSSMWHLSEVLDWMVENNKIASPDLMPKVEVLRETTKTAQAFNIVIQNQKIPDDIKLLAKEVVSRQ